MKLLCVRHQNDKNIRRVRNNGVQVLHMPWGRNSGAICTNANVSTLSCLIFMSLVLVVYALATRNMKMMAHGSQSPQLLKSHNLNALDIIKMNQKLSKKIIKVWPR